MSQIVYFRNFLCIIIGEEKGSPIFYLVRLKMQILKCPICGVAMVKIYTIGDEKRNTVDFSIKNATQTVRCKNCGKKIAYSVLKNDKGVENGDK